MSNTRRILLACVMVWLFCAGTAFAAPSACPTTTGTLDRTFTGGTALSVTAPSELTTGVDDLATINGNSTPGCTAVNLAFSNFAVTSVLNSGTIETGNALPDVGGTYLASTAGTLEDTLTLATLLADTSETPQTLSTIDHLDNLKVNETENITDTTSYSIAAAGSTRVYSVTLDVDGITVATGGSGSVEIETCTGSTLAIADACSGGAGTVLTKTIALSTAASLDTEISLTNPAAFVFVTQVINLVSTAASTDETGFLTFSDQFEESPEPSTFILLGTALAAIGLLRLRASRRWDR
jgi:hypothetical protein